VNACEKRNFALEDIPDASGNSLIEKSLGEERLGVEAANELHDTSDVCDVVAQVWPQMIDGCRRAIAHEGVDGWCSKTHGCAQLGPDEDS